MHTLRFTKRKPTHPGAILREDVLPGLNLNQTQFAHKLKVSRRTISEILHERRPVTADMALRLAHFLDTTPESWLTMQQAVDLWELENQNHQLYENIQKHKPKKAA